VTAECG